MIEHADFLIDSLRDPYRNRMGLDELLESKALDKTVFRYYNVSEH